MEDILDNIGVEIVASLITAPIIALAGYLGARFWRRRPGAEGLPEHGPTLEWSELAYLIFYAVAVVGCALLGSMIVARLFGLESTTDWTVGTTVLAWLLYIVLAFGVGYVAQGILTVYKGGGGDRLLRLSSDDVTRRERVFMGSVWAKAAFLLLFLGWALLATPGHLLAPLFYGFALFWAVDVFGAIALLLVD